MKIKKQTRRIRRPFIRRNEIASPALGMSAMEAQNHSEVVSQPGAALHVERIVLTESTLLSLTTGVEKIRPASHSVAVDTGSSD